MRRTLILLTVPFLALGAQSEWTVATKPLLDLPGLSASGTANFEVLAGATRLSNGSILLADRSATVVKLFDPSGKLLKTGGGRGDGPGEFRSMVVAVACGRDSLLVWDLPKSTAGIVGPAGSVGRPFNVPSDSGHTIRRPLSVIACTQRGVGYVSDPNGRLAPDPANPNIMTMLDRKSKRL